jgi:hypothetical protein
MTRLSRKNSIYRLLLEVWRGPDVVTFRQGSYDRSKWRTDDGVRQYVVFGSFVIEAHARMEGYLDRVDDDVAGIRVRLTEAGKAFVDAWDVEAHGEPMVRPMKASGRLVQWGA